MILVLWLARLLNVTARLSRSRRIECTADAVYRVYFGPANRRARMTANGGRAGLSRNREWREQTQAIGGVVPDTRPNRVGSPFNGETR